MYLQTDLFDHRSHIEKLGRNESCIRCHEDYSQVKSRKTALKCETCHENMVVRRSTIEPPKEGMTGMASGYTDAMHGLCVKCHEKKVKEEPTRFGRWSATCANCHRDISDVDLKKMKPYNVEE